MRLGCYSHGALMSLAAQEILEDRKVYSFRFLSKMMHVLFVFCE